MWGKSKIESVKQEVSFFKISVKDLASKIHGYGAMPKTPERLERQCSDFHSDMAEAFVIL